MAGCAVRLVGTNVGAAAGQGAVICCAMREEGAREELRLSHPLFLERLLGWCCYRQPSARLSLKAPES